MHCLLRTSICFIFVIASFNSYSQETNEACFHSPISSSPSNMILYLHSKYGVEFSEQILLKIQDYNFENDVKVLCLKDYQDIQQQLNKQIEATTDFEEIEHLIARKNKFILLSTIENQFN